MRGLPGMCTVHANSARDAVTKICTLPLLAGENISPAFVIPTPAGSLDVVVPLRKDATGARRITEVVALPGGWRATSWRWPPHEARYAGVSVNRPPPGARARPSG